MKTLTALFLVFVQVMLVSFMTTSSSALTWSAEVQLDSFSAGSVAGSSLRIAAAPNGNIMAVWVQNDGKNDNIYSNLCVGGKWGTATLVESSTMPATEPRVTADANGNFIAVWRQAWNVVNGTNYGIYASRYVAGQGWGKTDTVFVDSKRTDISANGAVEVAMDPKGNAIAVWTVYDWSWNHTSVRSNRYVVGTGWSGVTNLSTEDVQMAFSPQVALDSTGNAMVVWRQDGGAGNKSAQGVHADYYTYGSGWGKPTLIESSANTKDRSGDGIRVAFDPAGNAIAAWYQYSKPGIFANRFVPGKGWETPQSIADPGKTSYDDGVNLALDKDGNAIATWNQSGGVLYANRFVSGSGWGTTVVVNPNGSDYSSQVAFYQNGSALAIWGQYACNSYNIMSSQYSAGTGWSAVSQCYDKSPSYINKTLDYTREPQLVIDSKGTATAVWIRGYGGYGSIFSSTAVADSQSSGGTTTITGSSGFDVSVTKSGTSKSLSLTAVLQADPKDVGKSENIYFILYYLDNLWFMNSSGDLVFFDGRSTPSLSNGKLASQTTLISFSGLNLSSLNGLSFIAGYGTSINEMIDNSRFKFFYTVQ